MHIAYRPVQAVRALVVAENLKVEYFHPFLSINFVCWSPFAGCFCVIRIHICTHIYIIYRPVTVVGAVVIAEKLKVEYVSMFILCIMFGLTLARLHLHIHTHTHIYVCIYIYIYIYIVYRPVEVIRAVIVAEEFDFLFILYADCLLVGVFVTPTYIYLHIYMYTYLPAS